MPARVNFVEVAYVGTSGTTFSAPAINITTGNTIVACFGADTTTWTITGVTDTAGNTYTLAVASASNYREEIWVAKNATGHATNIVTATFSTTVVYRAACVIQYSGLDATAPVDVTSYVAGPSTGAQTTGTLTGTTTDSVHILMSRWGFGDTTYPSGFTKFTNAAAGWPEIADKIITGGAFSGTHTLPNGHYYVLAVVLKGTTSAAASVRVTQDAIEVLSFPTPAARVTQSVVELLATVVSVAPPTAAVVTQAVVELLGVNPPPPTTRVTQQVVELLGLAIDSERITQLVVEAFVAQSTVTRASQIAVEVFHPLVVPTRATQFAVEYFNQPLLSPMVATHVVVEVFRLPLLPGPCPVDLPLDADSVNDCASDFPIDPDVVPY